MTQAIIALLLTLLLRDPHPASVSPFWPSLISSLGATLEGREAVPTYTLNRLWGLLFRNGAVKSAWLCTSQNPAITVSLSWTVVEVVFAVVHFTVRPTAHTASLRLVVRGCAFYDYPRLIRSARTWIVDLVETSPSAPGVPSGALQAFS
ncbi:hypothetical protein CIHG_01442 [Coccidioides immitis H538.4]|uniref:Secreted protein n=1 Tax=Coccidioides immitis H538.4 TaxID=396776 RepID=A0A0J8RI58_COCIT|nr:hypothetical protein CIHG_01442 [Coccidioides immitis H538.4]